MARTLDQIIRDTLGAKDIDVINLTLRVEALTDQVAALTAERDALKASPTTVPQTVEG
jgi:hypothetical protein